MIRYISFCALLIISLSSNAQQDCNSAYHFVDTIGSFEINNGYGKSLEISGYSIKNDKFFTKEHASAWVVIEFTRNGIFSFDLVPDNPAEDYDFVVFDYYGIESCDSIRNKTKLPIRSNLARRQPSDGSITGLNREAFDIFVPAGKGVPFSKAISVNKGDQLLLVFDAPYGVKNQFSIINSSIFEEEAIIPEITEVNNLVEVVNNSPKKVTFYIYDDQHQLVTSPKMILKSAPKDFRTNLTYDSVGNVFSDQFDSKIKQRILITQRGFVQEEFFFKWTGTTDTIIEYSLVRLQMGMKLQFENILFKTNSANILKGSEDELENLCVFLLSNDNLEVEIGGHIYSGKRRNKRKFIKLSKKRAKVVYDFLVNAGVEKRNLKHKGYGNSRMIYRFPKSEEEYRANRRVELTIISL